MRLQKWNIDTRWLAFLCVAAGFLLGGLLMGTERLGGEEGGLKRAAAGEGEVCYEIFAKGICEEEPEKELRVEIPVGERRYTDEEAERIFEEALPELVKQILGENSSLEEIRSDLKLSSLLEPYGLQIRWRSDQPELLDSFGGVHNEEIPESGTAVFLTAEVTDGIHKKEYQLRTVVFPPFYTSEEKAVRRFKEWVKQEDEISRTEKELKLPEFYQGRPLKLRRPEESSYWMLPMLGLLAGALLLIQEKNGEAKDRKKREELLLLDYSEVVSKLMVFIGAGMTLRLAWEKIVDGYDKKAGDRNHQARPVYEEMRYTVGQLKSGTPESRAYTEFGRRCNLQPYIKLAALLEQNRKTGSKNLKAALETEMASAFEQRKSIARRLGEEAGTKLLLPLFLMLGVVMIMIVVPAFLSFY